MRSVYFSYILDEAADIIHVLASRHPLPTSDMGDKIGEAPYQQDVLAAVAHLCAVALADTVPEGDNRGDEFFVWDDAEEAWWEFVVADFECEGPFAVESGMDPVPAFDMVRHHREHGPYWPSNWK